MTEFGSPLELTAVVLALAYLVLAVRENIACWYAAFASTAIFFHVFWQVNLYMEAGLQAFYLAMAVYGWWSWRHGGKEGKRLDISTWPWQKHALAIGFIAAATAVSGLLLRDTDQRLAFLDSFTTWSAVVTTIMVARKILENWLYWLVVDSLSILLYIDRELYFTAGLFMLYVIIAIFGWFRWRRLCPRKL